METYTMKNKIQRIRYHGLLVNKECSCVTCGEKIERKEWAYKDLKKRIYYCRTCAWHIAEAVEYGMSKVGIILKPKKK